MYIPEAKRDDDADAGVEFIIIYMYYSDVVLALLSLPCVMEF